MAQAANFEGFSKKSVDFLRQLARNNNREWFNEHKPEFEKHLMAPARAFVGDMGAELKKIAPNINADPRVNRSLFRLNRDTRFSKDKTPYKTHLGIWLWEGEAKRMESSGFYFHLEPPHVLLGVGMHCLPRSFLPHFRDSVAHAKKGAALARILAKATKNPLYQLPPQAYKRVPRGYDPQHERAELLKYDGMTLSFSTPLPDELYGPELIEWCQGHFREMAPLHIWMRDMAAEAGQDQG